MTIKYHSGWIGLRFFCHDGRPDIDLVNFPGQSPLLSYNDYKRLAGPPFAGSWNVSIADTPALRLLCGGLPLSECLVDDDWVVVEAGDGPDDNMILVGLIDTITEAVQYINGAEVTTYSVVGKDFAKVIDDTTIWFSELSDEANVVGKSMLDAINWTEIQQPSDLCKRFVEAFLTPGHSIPSGTWELPPGLVAYFTARGRALEGYAGSILCLDDVQETRGLAIIRSTLDVKYSLSSLLQQWCNPLLNELFFSLRVSLFDGLTPMMIMRERPFPVAAEPQPGSAWERLVCVTVPRSAVAENEWHVSRGGQERVNAVALLAQQDPGSAVEQYINDVPRLDVASIRKHGLRLMEQQSLFLSRIATPGAPAEWSTLLHSWYGINHALWSGEITLLLLDPEIDVGRKLVIGDGEDPGNDPGRWTFYVEAVNRDWSPDNHWSTTVNVTRGYRGPGGLLKAMQTAHFAKLSMGVDGPMAPTTSLAGRQEPTRYRKADRSRPRFRWTRPGGSV